MLENGLGRRCAFRQAYAEWNMVLEPLAGHRIPIGSWDAAGVKALQMSLVDENGSIARWSEPFPISRSCFVDVSDASLGSVASSISMVRTDIGIAHDGSRYLHVSPTRLSKASRIENCLNIDMLLRLSGNLDQSDFKGNLVDTKMHDKDWQVLHACSALAFTSFCWSGSEYLH